MTTFAQFCARAKMRHDFSDQFQVRYIHPNNEIYDTWVSGEEVLQRLKTASREKLIKGFSRLDWDETLEAAKKELEEGKKKARRTLKERLADTVEDNIGDNLFGDTFADRIRGVDSTVSSRDQERKRWQAHLQDEAFRAIVLEIAWMNLDGSLPEETGAEPDDWV